MVTWQPIDVEDLLRNDLLRMLPDDVHVAAPPLPRALAGTLPYVLLTRVGGSRVNIVMDAHRVSIDVYSTSWSAATSLADMVGGAVAQLSNAPQRVGDWRGSNIITLPYANPDPDHPTIPRMTLLVELMHRSNVIP
ncbi:DUF3168 domain-containing protein [Bifidobacterium vansinderenii]|uniref:DUF3168 domain-containing protein n=1 Tax=Bifidobacterium vansinderenii TaxID=1984871 RepID=A0A229VW73_9BIFI|nr:DUF3168 domain-containing protein [Bifidobacterium vansinderenii]OXM99878.1 hypothetical protein Tam10B_1841 [Bifidobacterium vansinderenii]